MIKSYFKRMAMKVFDLQEKDKTSYRERLSSMKRFEYGNQEFLVKKDSDSMSVVTDLLSDVIADEKTTVRSIELRTKTMKIRHVPLAKKGKATTTASTYIIVIEDEFDEIKDK